MRFILLEECGAQVNTKLRFAHVNSQTHTILNQRPEEKPRRGIGKIQNHTFIAMNLCLRGAPCRGIHR